LEKPNPRSVEQGTSSSASKVDSNEFKVMQSITENVSRGNREENWNKPLGKDSRERRRGEFGVADGLHWHLMRADVSKAFLLVF
jgi:hypothetical protein